MFLFLFTPKSLLVVTTNVSIYFICFDFVFFLLVQIKKKNKAQSLSTRIKKSKKTRNLWMKSEVKTKLNFNKKFFREVLIFFLHIFFCLRFLLHSLKIFFVIICWFFFSVFVCLIERRNNKKNHHLYMIMIFCWWL